MKMFFLFCFLFSFAFSQTRPTGGTGPKIESDLAISQTLSPLDLILSERVKKNYDFCDITIPRSENFDIYQLYVTLVTLNLYRTFEVKNSISYSFEKKCGLGPFHLTTQMACLLEGTDRDLNLFVSNRFAIQYLKNVFQLNDEEAKNMLNFLIEVNLSLQDLHSIN
jgi:hypothetical protein